MSESEYERRDRRILDAVAELLLRWGAKRVTIAEVAGRAGIGKGTVYLHFESRSRLLGAVLMRESLAITDELIAAIERDPAAAPPAEQSRLTYLAARSRPLIWAMLTRDHDLLGTLAHEDAVEPLRAWNREISWSLLRLCRDHGLLRDDLELDRIGLMLSAIQTGFYLHPATGDLKPATIAEALHDSVAAAVQPPGPAEPPAIAAAAAAILVQYRELRDRLAAEIARRPAGTEERS
ncbi:TetR/AcrR family transcriptional regulator [Microlunatus speluncae]|uniref:TetR/AcrR family transcriptional regulator n=1 Tax=Microlunatus speluncae TaxID=2594267 RepID=UPI0013759A4E|nr:TetR/AcrR family transcriptional regulator [Microlunatus speluncae]